MVSADLVRAGALATLPLAVVAGRLTAVHCLVVIAVSAAWFVAADTAKFGWLTALVGRSNLTEAHGTLGAVTSGIEIVGPALAGVMIAVLSPVVAIAFDAATFVVAAILVANIQATDSPRAADDDGMLRGFATGPPPRASVGGLRAVAGRGGVPRPVRRPRHPTARVRLG